MIKILLINPPFDLIKFGYGSKSKIKRGYLPPLGLGYLATYLINNGIETEILDASALGYSIDETVKYIILKKIDAVGITTTSINSNSALELAKEIKIDLSIPIIIGGPFANINPLEILNNNKYIDYVITGLGQEPLLKLLKKNFTATDISNIYYRNNQKKILFNKSEQYFLKDYPYPDRSLFQNELYIPLPNQSKKDRVTSAITSTGCPWGRCTYCFQSGEHSLNYSRRNVIDVIKEIEELKNIFGFEEISFWDDIFTINYEWIKNFCETIIKKNMNILWTCYGSVKTVNEPMLKLMKKAGCYSIYYGIESGCDKILEKIDKGITCADIKEKFELTAKIGIEIRGAIIYGFPSENYQQGLETLKFVLSLPMNSCQFRPYCPEKGTKLYSEIFKNGKIEKNYMDAGIHDVVYTSNGYKNREQLQKLIKKSYNAFYLRPSYILKSLKNISSLEDIKRLFDGLKFFIGLK